MKYEEVEEAIDLIDNLIGMIDDSQENDYDKAFNMAIKSLRKQIPKKPIFVHVREFVGDRIYKCPSCGGPLGVKSFALRQGTIGCSRCLQAIDWSEVDD